MKFIYALGLLSIILFFACVTSKKAISTADTPLTKAIKSHGGKKYEAAYIGFTFRKKAYTFKNTGGAYEYTRTEEKDGQQIFDVLNNDGFKRNIAGVAQNLSDKDILKYGNSLNSVIYFAQLPYKLDDPAVTQVAKGKTSIKGKAYEVIQVSFAKEGGGTDHDDTYYYWVNQSTNIIDYLAYDFHVNGGGVRFRSAYNPRKVGGLHFQDYVNYKAPVNTPLADLPAMYEKGALKELSKIELEDIRVLK